MPANKLKLIFLSLGLPIFISGCVAAVSLAAITVVDVVHDRRTAGAYIDDGTIELKVREQLIRDPEFRRNAHVSVTSVNGTVLLTGELPTQAMKDKIVAHTQGIQGVRQVVNELRIAGKTALFSRANDTWLTTKVKTRLFEAARLDAARIKVVSEYGNVYLLGVVNRAEAKTATDAASRVSGVVRVVKVFEYSN